MIGIVHPGAMGALVGRVLAGCGHEVGWAAEGRSAATRERAAGFADLGTPERLRDSCEVVLSVCPPHAAVAVAELAEVGRTFAAAGQPEGFGAAAAEVFRALPREC